MTDAGATPPSIDEARQAAIEAIDAWRRLVHEADPSSLLLELVIVYAAQTLDDTDGIGTTVGWLPGSPGQPNFRTLGLLEVGTAGVRNNVFGS